MSRNILYNNQFMAYSYTVLPGMVSDMVIDNALDLVFNIPCIGIPTCMIQSTFLWCANVNVFHVFNWLIAFCEQT